MILLSGVCLVIKAILCVGIKISSLFGMFAYHNVCLSTPVQIAACLLVLVRVGGGVVEFGVDRVVAADLVGFELVDVCLLTASRVTFDRQFGSIHRVVVVQFLEFVFGVGFGRIQIRLAVVEGFPVDVFDVAEGVVAAEVAGVVAG